MALLKFNSFLSTTKAHRAIINRLALTRNLPQGRYIEQLKK